MRAIAPYISSSSPQVAGTAVPSGPPRSVWPMKRIILWQNWIPERGLGTSSLFLLISVSISVHQWFISLSGILCRHAAINFPTISRPAICLPFREDRKWSWDPGVSLRSTPGYHLACLRHARFTTDDW